MGLSLGNYDMYAKIRTPRVYQCTACLAWTLVIESHSRHVHATGGWDPIGVPPMGSFIVNTTRFVPWHSAHMHIRDNFTTRLQESEMELPPWDLYDDRIPAGYRRIHAMRCAHKVNHKLAETPWCLGPFWSRGDIGIDGSFKEATQTTFVVGGEAAVYTLIRSARRPWDVDRSVPAPEPAEVLQPFWDANAHTVGIGG